MERKSSVKRGEIYEYQFGNEPDTLFSGTRMVLVLQADLINEKVPTAVVAVIIQTNRMHFLPTHIDLGSDFGLSGPSMLLAEQVIAVRQDELQNLIGVMDDRKIWRKIKNGLMMVFGYWENKVDPKADIRCLCPRCRKDLMASAMYSIRPVDPFRQKKDTCDKCDRLGEDFIITPKSKKPEGSDGNVEKH